MSDADLDTDTLLAILSSLLDSPIPEQHILLNALVRFNGDVDQAAKSLQQKVYRSSDGASHCLKRPIITGVLDDWLTPSPREVSRPQKKCKVVSNAEKMAPPHLRYAETLAVSPSRSVLAPKRLVPLAEVLRAPSSTSSTAPRLAPLTLSNPTMVQKHTPCTMHLGVLPSELALRLFQVMIDASREWKPNKWWLFERIVESPHKTSFYARRVDGISENKLWQEAAQYWYNGRPTHPPTVFTQEMEEACQIVEKIVNEAISRRPRYPLEWGGADCDGQVWKANVAAVNCYTGAKEGVGFHSDQLTYLGPYPTIASLSLGTTRIFRLREVIPRTEVNKRQAQTFNIPVVHNSLVIMHASTQERFKHSIPAQNAIDLFRPNDALLSGSDMASNCRINITFRFYRPDFRPPSVPRCKCNIPCVLRADMKGRDESSVEEKMRYFWMCYGGAQKEGKGCSFFKVMDGEAEGRGPFVGDLKMNH